MTIHCIDVSGSMSAETIGTAKTEMLKRFKRGDKVVIFSDQFALITDMDRNFAEYADTNDMNGGSYAIAQVLEYVKQQNTDSALYSDGLLVPEDLARFDTFVKVG